MILSLKFFKISLLSFVFVSLAQLNVYSRNWTNDVLIKELKSKVSQAYNVSESDVSIDWKDESLEKKVKDLQKFYPGKSLDIQIRETTIKDISGKPGIPLDVNIDGKQNRIIYVRCNIDVLKETLVASNDIKKSEDIDEFNLKYSKVPIHKIPKNVYADSIEKLKGKIAMTDIKQNTVITSNLLKEKVIVFKGNQVTIRIRNGDLILTGVGEALQDGYSGQNISVKITSFSSKRTVMAKVLEASLVEVNLGGSN